MSKQIGLLTNANDIDGNSLVSLDYSYWISANTGDIPFHPTYGEICYGDLNSDDAKVISLNYRAEVSEIYAKWCRSGGKINEECMALLSIKLEHDAPTIRDRMFLLTIKDSVRDVINSQ